MESSALSSALQHFDPVIGLEVHAQLATDRKLFSSAPHRYDPDHPNSQVNEYCFGLPGVLPVPSREAVTLSIKAGLALNCRINQRSTWARKQYFYPDLPKGYQISQYEEPICQAGFINIPGNKIGITRIHMEEDAGKSIHVQGASYSLVDLNRAGVPLIEIVSEPDLRSSADAVAYLKELHAILTTIEVCDGNMEQGSFRCDANVSIRPLGQVELGTRCEIKNVNSFRFIEQAIDFEIVRQAKLLKKGTPIEQQTRLFDSVKKETRPMRSKEEANDYRYFPDPDLPPLIVDPDWVDTVRKTLPELPAAKRARFTDLGLPEDQVGLFAADPTLANFVDRAVAHRPGLALGIGNLVAESMLRALHEEGGSLEQSKLGAETLAELVELREKGRISSTQQKKMFVRLWKESRPLMELLKEMGEQISDPSLLNPVIETVLSNNQDNVDKYRAGKTKVINALLGQVMKALKGKANPALVKKMLEEKMKASQ